MGVLPVFSSWGLCELEGHQAAPLDPSDAVRCASTGDWPGCLDISVSHQASFLSFLNYLRGMSVAGLAGAIGDLFAEAGFFETDFCFFDFGRQAAGLQALFGLLHCRLRAVDIDIFGRLGDLGHDRHFGWCDFRIAPEDRHVVGLVSDAIAKLADA